MKLSILFVENMVKEMISPSSTPRTRSPRASGTLRPEVVENLLQEFVKNSITEQKKPSKKDYAERRRTWNVRA